MLVLSGQLTSVDRLAFSPQSDILAAAGGNNKPIELWSLAQPRQPQHRLPVRLERTNWSFCFNPASGLLLVAEGTHVIGFDPKTGKELWRIEPEENSVIAGIDVSADGRRLATAAIFQYLADDGYQVWDLNGRKPPKRRKTMHGGADQMCRTVRFLPGNRIAFAEDNPPDGRAVVNVVTSTGRSVSRLETPYPMVQFLAARAEGPHLAGLFGRNMLIWDLKHLNHPPIIVANTTRLAFTGIDFHPSGRFLAATSNDETVKLYDTETWQIAQTFSWNIGRLRSIAFSPDGNLAAAGSDTGKIVVWDVDL